jgi:hypothetical protein
MCEWTLEVAGMMLSVLVWMTSVERVERSRSGYTDHIDCAWKMLVCKGVPESTTRLDQLSARGLTMTRPRLALTEDAASPGCVSLLLTMSNRLDICTRYDSFSCML